VTPLQITFVLIPAILVAAVLMWRILLPVKGAKMFYAADSEADEDGDEREVRESTDSRRIFLEQLLRRQNPRFGEGADPVVLVQKALNILEEVPLDEVPQLRDILQEALRKHQLPPVPNEDEDRALQNLLQNWAIKRRQLQRAS